MRFTFVFCCKRMKPIQAIKVAVVFIKVIPHNDADSLFTAR